MKNLKKVLALAVAFVMCFTMFAGALVFTDVPAGGDYSAAITLLSDLGVIAGKPDGSFGVNDAITRADAVCLIARLMTGEQNPPKYNNAPVFTDVVPGSYYESSVGYCASMGITSGTGNGKFSPSKTITDGEFIAMLTRALGYDTPEHPLQWPMGNIVVAEQKGLLKGVQVEYMSDALRGEDAQMLANALFADFDGWAAKQNLYQNADDLRHKANQPTIAEVVFGLGRLAHDADVRDVADSVDFYSLTTRANVVDSEYNMIGDCDSHTWVIAGVDARNAENTYVAFAIDDDDEKALPYDGKSENKWKYQTFTYTGDVKPFLGYRVELWGEMGHTGKSLEVTAIRTLDGQSAYDYNAGMFDDDANNKIKLEDKTLVLTTKSNKTHLADIQLKADETFTVDGDKNDKNAYALVTVGESDPKTSSYRHDNKDGNYNIAFRDGDQYKLIDWNGDDDVDFVVRETFKYGEVSGVSKNRIVIDAEDAKANQRQGSYALKLDDDNLVVEGAEGIEEGDIVEISVVDRKYSKGDDEVVTIELTKVDAANKELEKINLTTDTYTFDGDETYVAHKDLFDLVEEDTTYEELRQRDNVGHAFDLFLDKSGFIVKAVLNDESARGYLMILDTVDGDANLNVNNKRSLAAIDVLFDDNTTQDEVPVIKDLKIDGKTDGTTGYNKSNRTWDQLLVVGNAYKYYMNDDKQITRLESITNNTWGDYAYDESKGRLALSGYTANGKTVPQKNLNVDDDAVIFAVVGHFYNNKLRPGDTATNTNADYWNNVGPFTDQNKEWVNNGHILPNGKNYNSDFDPAKLDAVGTQRYHVDPDLVVAVKKSDIPEIHWDNDIFGTAVTGSQKVRNYEDTRPAAMGYVEGREDDNDNRWIKNYHTAIGYETNSKGDISAAVIGVNTLDYFSQNEVKVALITDISKRKDAYEVYAAIDGEVKTFDTVDEDEADLFTGRFTSADDMQSYLDQQIDDGKGNRNGLYAEVTMNSDGKITKLRAMDFVRNTNWDNDNVGNYMEGNVYRVIRGVTTQLRSNDWVTWQVNPVAKDGDTLYELDKNGDYNAGDVLEGQYNADTNFYKVKGLPNLVADNEMTIDLGFAKELSDKKRENLTAADSSVLEASFFTDIEESAEYFVADFAVRKSDTDKLVAVFAFGDDLTNTGDAKPADGISITPDELTVVIGETGEATVTVRGVGATLAGSTVTSSDTSKATVAYDDTTGVATITGVAAGTVTLTATDANTNTDTCTVTVVAAPTVPTDFYAMIGYNTDVMSKNVNFAFWDKDSQVWLSEAQIEALELTASDFTITVKNSLGKETVLPECDTATITTYTGLVPDKNPHGMLKLKWNTAYFNESDTVTIEVKDLGSVSFKLVVNGTKGGGYAATND